MIWQDLVFAVGMIALTIFLIPAVRSKTHKPPLLTSLGHGSVMVVFALTYVTLHFWFATAMAAAEGALWFWLATQHRLVEGWTGTELRAGRIEEAPPSPSRDGVSEGHWEKRRHPEAQGGFLWDWRR